MHLYEATSAPLTVVRQASHVANERLQQTIRVLRGNEEIMEKLEVWSGRLKLLLNLGEAASEVRKPSS